MLCHILRWTTRYFFFVQWIFSPEIIFALFKTHILLTVLMIIYNLDILLHWFYLVIFFIFLDLFSDIAYFDIKLLPRDDNGNILFPQIPKRLGIFYHDYFLNYYFYITFAIYFLAILYYTSISYLSKQILVGFMIVWL